MCDFDNDVNLIHKLLLSDNLRSPTREYDMLINFLASSVNLNLLKILYFFSSKLKLNMEHENCNMYDNGSIFERRFHLND